MPSSASDQSVAAPGIWHSGLWQREELAALIEQLQDMRSEMLRLESKAEPLWKGVRAEKQPSARNLMHYVAFMGARAECVMLNKGPNIVGTVEALCDTLRRMQSHQLQKRPTSRRLRMADHLCEE